MKKLALISMIIGSFILASCGGSKNDKNDDSSDSSTVEVKTATDVCTNENNISMTIKDHELKEDEVFLYETSAFEVKMSKFTYKNDSTAEFKISNYTQEELVGDRKDDQIDIFVELHSKHGKLLEPAVYGYQEWDADYWAKVNLITSQGTVWFNWVSGMPDQGNLTIDFIDKDNVCGSFNLNVEKPEHKSIGTVRLNGTFQILK